MKSPQTRLMIVPLREATDANAVGNKAAALASLLNCGAAVPPGFVVTVDAYRKTIDEIIKQHPEPTLIHSKLLQVTFDAELIEQISNVCQTLLGKTGDASLVVRSSSTAEDSLETSFAGQFRTVSDVRDATQCLNAIRECWSSVWASNVMAYCEKHHVDIENINMGVLIQIQRIPTAAGVLFTQDPFSSTAGVTYAEVISGNATALVDGSADPDFRFWSNDDGKLERVDYYGDVALLPTEVCQRLVGVAREIHDLFGRPQDIEWTYDPTHGIEIVQARPITRGHETQAIMQPDAWQLPGRPLGGWSTQQRQIFDQWDLYNPATITPLDWGLFERTAWEANLRMFDFLTGVPHVEEVAVIVDGVVVNVDPTGRQSNSDQRIRVPQYEVVDDWEPTFTSWETRLSSFRREVAMASNDATALTELLIQIGDFYAECHCIRMASTARWIDPMGELDPAEDAESKVRELLKGAYGQDTPTVLIDIGSGIDHDTSQMNEQLWELCNTAATCSPNAMLSELKTRIDEFVLRFGHFQHDNVPLGTNPSFILNQVKAATETRDAGPNVVMDGRNRYTNRLREMETRLSSNNFTLVLKEIQRLRLWTARRESSKSRQNIALPLMRSVIHTIGTILHAMRALDIAEDIAYLAPEELRRVVNDGWKVPPTLLDKRKQHVAWKLQRSWLPEGFFGDTADRSHDSFTGEGVSEGIAQGRVCVVSGPEEFFKVRRNDIIVASTTSPIWSQVMSKTSAIIVEFGARLSHTSIAAREYNIPAVVNLRNAKSIFVDGDIVEVNGASGSVRFISRLS